MPIGAPSSGRLYDPKNFVATSTWRSRTTGNVVEQRDTGKDLEEIKDLLLEIKGLVTHAPRVAVFTGDLEMEGNQKD